LEENINEPISSYSHGMKKKIQIISALMNPFDLLILDEPCRGLDIESIYIIKRLLKEFRDGNKAIFISSHDLLFVEEICTRMLILSNGILVDEGSVKELKNKYQSQTIEDVFLKAAMAKERGEKIESLLRDIKNNTKDIC
jgi:ABC-2 type transport system ATP-binding protein